MPRPARRGLPDRAGELEPGDDHDRPRVRRRDLRRAPRPGDGDADHRAGAPGRAAPHDRRPDRAEPRDRAPRRRGARPLRGRAHRRRASRRSTLPRTGRASRPRCRRSVSRVPAIGLAYGVDEALAVGRVVGFPIIVRPSFILGGGGTGFARDEAELRGDRRARAGREPGRRDPDRAVGARLEGVRARGDARRRGQRRGHLLDREPRSHGRAHRRLDHGRAGPDAHRRRVPADARRGVRVHPSHRRRHGRIEHPVRSRSDQRRDGRHRDEPTRVAFERAREQGDRLPDREDRGMPRGGLPARRDPQRHHRRDPRELRAHHRLRRHEGAAVGLREAAGRDSAARHPDAVGRRGDGHRPHVPRVAAEGAPEPRDRPARPERRSGGGRARSRPDRRAGAHRGDADTRSDLPARGRAATRRGAWTGSTRSRASTPGSSIRCC